jgi:hypothetical protein
MNQTSTAVDLSHNIFFEVRMGLFVCFTLLVMPYPLLSLFASNVDLDLDLL